MLENALAENVACERPAGGYQHRYEFHGVVSCMPRYYFDVKDGTRLADPSGLECRDDEDARAKAKVIAEAIGLDALVQGGTRELVILNEDGDEVAHVPIPGSSE
jgi:hypothetical protein